MMLVADTPVQFIKGVGPGRSRMLAKAGIETVDDLLRLQPFRYEDRTNFARIADLQEGREAVVEAEVLVSGNYTTPMKRMRIFEMLVRDSSDNLPVKFFNQPYLEKVFRKGCRVVLFGTPRMDDYTKTLTFINPEFEVAGPEDSATIHTGRIVPVYRRIDKLQTRALRQMIFQVLTDVREESVRDFLPEKVLERYGFPSRLEALRFMHFPVCPPDQDRSVFLDSLAGARTPAQQRLIFEEFFFFQLGLKVVKQRRRLLPKERKIDLQARIREVIKSVLPFHPTSAQKRVLREIVDDLAGDRPMSRLVQGDVGSGKTIVAIQAIIVVIENGYQAAMMAPTEILAEQHFRTAKHYLEGTGYRIELLSGKTRGRRRKEILEKVEAGEIDLLIGTHALFQQGVSFRSLGLVVIDEQHRFGVVQRSRLMEKGSRPDTLVMTATPIPRSLAMTLYGDLDLSVIDELPPGRQPVKTLIRSDESREEVYRAVRRQLAEGRQVYIVYPLVEQSEKVDLRAATEMSGHLQRDVFPGYHVGLMHGRLKPEEKDRLMEEFKQGKVHLLVSTTVIEVGIDVPNATMMIVEHADRFGLSQLHQLRGRIGRGIHPGVCVLMSPGPMSPEAFQRLEIMRRSSDGFKIAEKDLEIRGPGDFLGTRQSGLPTFQFGNIIRDRKWLAVAETEAVSHLESMLKRAEDPRALLSRIGKQWTERFGLYEVG